MFTLKKTIAAFLFPVPVVLIILLTGVILLWTGRRRKLSRWMLTLGTGMLFVAAFPAVSDALLSQLEHTHEVFRTHAHPGFEPAWIVVLDAGYRDDQDLPPEQQLSPPSLARILEGIRLARTYPDARLLLSGGTYQAEIPGAEIMKLVATNSGVPSDRIVLETASWDTDDQARNIRDRVGDEPILLVTSAAHMDRSLALFEKQGMRPMPAPTDFQSAGRLPKFFRYWLPNALSLRQTRIVVYERLGITWARIKGHI
jgi:uncharacterized SAM-binding protein YcdF (DUF218 family)